MFFFLAIEDGLFPNKITVYCHAIPLRYFSFLFLELVYEFVKYLNCSTVKVFVRHKVLFLKNISLILAAPMGFVLSSTGILVNFLISICHKCVNPERSELKPYSLFFWRLQFQFWVFKPLKWCYWSSHWVLSD